MEEYKSNGKLGFHKQSKVAWLRSFEMNQSGEIVTIAIEADGLEGQKPTLEFSNSRLKMGYLRRKNGKVNGVVNHEFVLPSLSNASISEYGSSGNLLWISLINHEFKKRKNTYAGRSRQNLPREGRRETYMN